MSAEPGDALLPPRHSSCDLQVWGEQLPGRYKEPGGLRTQSGAAQDNSVWAGRTEVGSEFLQAGAALELGSCGHRELGDPEAQGGEYSV